MQPPRFLVQAEDDRLHGYNREDILQCDLATNRATPPKQIFKLDAASLTISYYPIAASEISAETAPALFQTSTAPALLKA